METQEKSQAVIFLEVFLKSHRTFTIWSIQSFMRQVLSWNDVESLDDVVSKETKKNAYTIADELSFMMLEFGDIDVYEQFEKSTEVHCKLRILQLAIIAIKSREALFKAYDARDENRAHHIAIRVKKTLEQFDDIASRVMRDDVHTDVFAFMES